MPETVTYYFNARGASGWTNPDNMIDGSIDTFASALADTITAALSGNDCPGADLGTITKVEMRAYAAGDADDLLTLQPVFAAGNGTKKSIAPGTTPTWIAYQDITTDTNAPSPWTFAAVVALDMIVGANKTGKANTMKCYRVEVRITYELYPEAPTNLASPSQTENSIDLTWTKGLNCDKTLIRFKEGGYPTSISDGYEAYFGTGESVTVQGGDKSIIQELSNADRSIYFEYCIKVGERVNNFPIGNISRVSFKLRKYGLPTGTAYIRIRKVSDDSILATIAELDVETLTTTATWYDFDCNVDNPTAQDLRFSVEYDGGDYSNYVRIYYQATNVLADAVRCEYLTSWADLSTADCAIKIYSSVLLTPATTYYFRAWGYQSATGVYSEATADLTQATAGAEIIETIVAKEFPMGYYQTTGVKELRSKVSGATITEVAKNFPPLLQKSGKAKDLISKWS